MHTSATNKKISDLMVDYSSGVLKANPDFQRRLVWTDKDKLNFIQTILDGFPFPEIFIAKGEMDFDTGKSILWLVDGQQRITTIYEYFSNSDSFPNTKKFAKYADLNINEKKSFLNYDVPVRDLGSVELDEVKEIFKRINNTSYNLNPMEINNAFYNGALKILADNLLESKYILDKRLFTPNDKRRMNDTLFALHLIITCMSDYYNSSSSVEPYLKRYNNSIPKEREYRLNFETTLKFIHDMNFTDDIRVWNKADFLTLFVEIYRALIKQEIVLNSTKTEKKLKEFYYNVSNVANAMKSETTKKNEIIKSPEYIYYESALQGSSSKSSRERRGEILKSLLTDCSN